MQANIVGISQDLSFEQGERVDFLLLRIPDGTIIRALIDQETAQKLVALHVNGEEQNGAPLSHEQPRQTEPTLQQRFDMGSSDEIVEHSPVENDEDEDAVVFGGPQPVDEDQMAALQRGLDTAEERIAKATPPAGEMTPEAIREIAKSIKDSDQEGSMPVPSWNSGRRNVTKTPKGYPVLQGDNMVDPGELVGGEDVDEEGVGQV